MSSNHIKRVAIVGAGGQSGTFITKALIVAGRFEITALTRLDSSNTMPEGISHVAKVDYDEKSSLVSALTGQDCLIITMSVFAAPDSSQKLLEAAAEARVPWVLPNEWGVDYLSPTAAQESLVGGPIVKARQLIKDLGVSSYISFVCSFWYEYSLAAGPWSYGFDFDNKKVTFFGDGDVKMNTATWPKVGAGVAALLSLPIEKEESATGPCLNDFKNASCYVFSFQVTQKQMFESVLRVTGAKESDWTIEYEDVKQRYTDGLKAMEEGKREGFGKALYSRIFYPDAPGDYDSIGLNDCKRLGLQQEDLDEQTKVAVGRWQEKGHLKIDT